MAGQYIIIPSIRIEKCGIPKKMDIYPVSNCNARSYYHFQTKNSQESNVFSQVFDQIDTYLNKNTKSAIPLKVSEETQEPRIHVTIDFCA